MKIIFTICSNNYLAQAKALGDSITKTNPDYQFFIGLVDQLSTEINYETEIGFPIILCNEIGIPDFESLWKKYNIIELNTCVKPFFLEYFTHKHPDLTHLMYFDPDTFVFGNLNAIETELSDSKEIILTPHILTPIPLDGKMPNEHLFLNFGIYNLGFIGIKNPSSNVDFFKWWGERTYHLGYDKVSEGLFVDQLWMNYAPIFKDNVVISQHYGLNMGPWNLHERFLSKQDKWMVNDNSELVFYHFSNYKYNKPEILASYYNRFTFEDRKDLVELYNDYSTLLHQNNIQKISNIPCYYIELRNQFINKKNDIERQKEWESIYKKMSWSSKIKFRLKQYLKK